MFDGTLLVCVTSGEGRILIYGGFRQALRISRERFAPDALGATNREVARVMRSERTDQRAEVHLIVSGVLRYRAEGSMLTGGGFPNGSAPILRMWDAAVSRDEQSLVFAGSQGAIAFAAVAKEMRRLFGSCGGAARQDV